MATVADLQAERERLKAANAKAEFEAAKYSGGIFGGSTDTPFGVIPNWVILATLGSIAAFTMKRGKNNVR